MPPPPAPQRLRRIRVCLMIVIVGLVLSGLTACVLVLPLALICGPIRGIPFGWQLIDCSFGLLCAIPLGLVLHWTKVLPE